jgi:phosphoribosyl 1,2-cyclic phosphodiesterase
VLRFASLGSGSSGNATVVSDGQTHILIDCGFSAREADRRLKRLQLDLPSISAVVVTHEHGDHIRGVPLIARKCGLPVYMTPGTYHARSLGVIPRLQLIHNCESFSIGNIAVQPVPVPHDAREPVQFLFFCAGKKLGVLTDLGSVNQAVIDAYQACDALLVEANHDRQMLASGPYPLSLKRRVAGPWGHLSNEQTAALLEQIDTSCLQHLVVGHISRKNNSLALAQAALASLTKPLAIAVFACQDEGFGWLELT